MNDLSRPEKEDDVERPQTLSGDPIQNYRLARVMAGYEERWRECIFERCRKRQRCKGGPRGTFTREGRPVCEKPGFGLPPYLRTSDGLDPFNPVRIPPEVQKTRHMGTERRGTKGRGGEGKG